MGYQHPIIDRQCKQCGVAFRGKITSHYCDECAAIRHRARNRTSNKPIPEMQKQCRVCAKVFTGTERMWYCPPCRQGVLRAQNAKRKARARARLLGLPPEPRKLKEDVAPKKVRPTLPPPCRECVYCEPREDFESGMVCRAEAMLRCRPYAPGAVPLVKKEKV